MWVFKYLLLSLFKPLLSVHYEYITKLVSIDDVITEFETSVTSCFLGCRRHESCDKVAFRKEPIMGEIASCLFLKDSPTTSTSGEKISVVLTNTLVDFYDHVCPRKQSIAEGRKSNPNCFIKSIDGGWSTWSNFSACKCRILGQGTRYRRRLCNQPYPTYGGDDCLASDEITRLTVEDEFQECGFDECPEPKMCHVLFNDLNDSSSGMSSSGMSPTGMPSSIYTNLTYADRTEFVTCEQNTNGEAKILLKHNREISIRYGYQSGGKKFISISYKNTYAFMRSVVDTAASCKQGFRISSKNIAPSTVYFESFTGNKTYLSSQYCNNCANLFKNADVLAQGYGYIEKKDLLPIKGLFIQDIDQSLEYAYVKFDPVVCIELIDDQ